MRRIVRGRVLRPARDEHDVEQFAGVARELGLDLGVAPQHALFLLVGVAADVSFQEG